MTKRAMRQLTEPEVQLRTIQDLLKKADKDKFMAVSRRFDGLINAYKDDPEALSIINLLMAEYTLLKTMERDEMYRNIQ